MSDGRSGLANRAEMLRLAFDRSFAAQAGAEAAVTHEDVLAIRLAAQPYAIRLSEIAGLYADKVIVPIPANAPGLLGIAGFRGVILPVYGLHVFLGHAAKAAPRWIAIASGAPIAVAFEGFDGHIRLPRSAILPLEGDGRDRRFISEFAQTDGIIRPIAQLAAIRDTITRGSRRAAAGMEG